MRQYEENRNTTSAEDMGKPQNSGGASANRIDFIDSIKGFAIICVVLGHIVGGYYDANSYPHATDLLYITHNLIYTFHMPLLMMVSGYVYYMAYYNNEGIPKREKICRQVVNMCYVYVLFSSAYGITKIVFSKRVTSEISFLSIVQIPLKPISLYWYMYILILLYLLFSITIVERMAEKKLLISTFAISILGQLSNISLFDCSRLMNYIFYFYVGLAYRKYKGWFFKEKIYIVPMLLLSIILTSTLWDAAKERAIYIHEIPVIGIFVALGISLAIWNAFEAIHPLSGSKLLTFLGRHSLEIYVLHGFLVSGLRILFDMVRPGNVYLSICMDLSISIFLPILFAEICKHLKIYDLFFKPTNYIVSFRK